MIESRYPIKGRTLLCAMIIASAWLGLAPAASADLSSAMLRIEKVQAERGNPESQYHLARRYEAGRGVDKNVGKAREWYIKAAEQGYAMAQYKLGYLLENGLGGDVDAERARQWYQRAADNGNDLAARRLAALAKGEGAASGGETAGAEPQKDAKADTTGKGEDQAEGKTAKADEDGSEAAAAAQAAAKEKAQREAAARKKAAKEKAQREAAARKKAAKEKAQREVAARKKAAQEKARREAAAREQARREAAAAKARREADARRRREAQAARERAQGQTSSAAGSSAAGAAGAAAGAAQTAAASRSGSSSGRSRSRPAVRDVKSVVLGSKWSDAGRPADFLPSTKTNCLSASDSEVVCFSSERTRNVGSSRITYTAKATLTRFGDDGGFQVRYLYDVHDVDDAAQPGPSKDPAGLRAETGWQEPAQVMRCRAQDRSTLRCRRDGHTFTFEAG